MRNSWLPIALHEPHPVGPGTGSACRRDSSTRNSTPSTSPTSEWNGEPLGSVVACLNAQDQAGLIRLVCSQCEIVLSEGVAVSAGRETIRIRRLPRSYERWLKFPRIEAGLSIVPDPGLSSAYKLSSVEVDTQRVSSFETSYSSGSAMSPQLVAENGVISLTGTARSPIHPEPAPSRGSPTFLSSTQKVVS